MLPPFLLASILLLTVWVFVMLLSEETRKEQLIMSVIGLVVAPGALIIASADYRAAFASASNIGYEDLIFAFSMFGLAAVVYQVLFQKHMRKPKTKPKKRKYPNLHWAVKLFAIGAVWLCVAVFTNIFFGLPSVHAAMVGGLLIGIYVIADRKDLLRDALYSGLIVAVLIFVLEQIFFVRLFPEVAGGFWKLENVSGLVLAGVPAEEVLWAAVVGFTVGPLYEYLRDWRLK